MDNLDERIKDIIKSLLQVEVNVAWGSFTKELVVAVRVGDELVSESRIDLKEIRED